MPKISVLLPTYRRPVLIRRALDSIHGQTFQDFELIVIENGSDEGVRERYKPVEANVKEWDVSQWLVFDWASLPRALNQGLAAATGKYVSIMEDDDEWRPAYLEKLSGHLDHCTCGMVFCNQVELDAHGTRITAGVPIPQYFSRRALLHQNFIGLPMAMYRKVALDAIGGFDEEAGPATDWIAHCMISGLYDIHQYQQELTIHHWQLQDAETPNYCLTHDDYRFTLRQRRYWAEGKFGPTS